MALFLALLCSGLLTVTGCDLLNAAPKTDYLDKIDSEIDRANAAKLTVTVANPLAWGSSPQAGTGRCGDVRKGYAFDVEFTPSAAYSLVEWRAYASSSLPADWMSDPVVRLAGIATIDGTVIPAADPNGGVTTITINTTEPVTLIPWCVDTPRVLKTDPSRDIIGGYYNPSKIITVTFAAAINESTAGFAPGCVEITMRDIDSNGNPIGSTTHIDGIGGADKYYGDPVWNSGPMTLTIEPINLTALMNVEVTVRLGTGIKSILSDNGMAEEFVFSWKIKDLSGVDIKSWQAVYSGDTITVTWDLSNADVPVSVYYSQNSGVRQNAENDQINNKAYIRGVSGLNTGGVSSGQNVINTQCYEIYMELYSGGASSVIKGPLKIWNVPGMDASWENPIIEVNSANAAYDAENNTIGLANMALGDSTKKYVLANDIALTGAWTPIGTGTNAFMGKFYGNGKTITFNSAFVAATHTGIFGYVKDAEIRDLTVNYTANVSANSSTNTGGIIGYAGCTAPGTTAITNCIVSGDAGASLSVTDSTSSGTTLGGIVGLMESGVVIQNSYAALNVGLTKNGAGNPCVGGVAGKIGLGTDDINPDSVDAITDTYILSDVKAINSVGCTRNTTTGFMYAGGITGRSSSNGGKLRRVSYGGSLTMIRNYSGEYYSLYGGGIAGFCSYPQFEDCTLERNGSINIPQDKSSSDVYIGGIAGYLEGTGSLSNCVARGDFELHTGYENATIGGVASFIDGDIGVINLTNCSYEQGIIYVQPATFITFSTSIGGVVGSTAGSVEFNNCHSRASRIEANIANGRSNVVFGGFISVIESTAIQNCDNASPLVMTNNGQYTSNPVYMGGFVGLIQDSGKLVNCWSTGVISSRGAGKLCTGGLIGAGEAGGYDYADTNENIIIQNCYAAGNVSAVNICTGILNYGTGALDFHTGGLIGIIENSRIDGSWSSGEVLATLEGMPSSGQSKYSTGGLVGCLFTTGSISNCYALGKVEADNQYYNPVRVYAGGLAGLTDISGLDEPDLQISNSYAKESVIARSAGIGAIYAGGVIGYKSDGSLSNTVAIGDYIIAKGMGGPTAARIYGFFDGTAPSNNYAKSDMKLFTAASYNADNADIDVINKETGLPNGADAGALTSETVWTGLGFTPPTWSFNSISIGYPRLAWEQ